MMVDGGDANRRESSRSVVDVNTPFVQEQDSLVGGAMRQNSSCNSSPMVQQATPEKTVKIIAWNHLGRCYKADLSAEQVVDLIVTRADSIRNSNFYMAFGILCAAFISCLPFIYRCVTVPNYIIFEGQLRNRNSSFELLVG